MSNQNNPNSKNKKDKRPSGKTRITIRLDPQIVAWFKQQAEEIEGATYQSLINQALLKHIENQHLSIEKTIETTIEKTVRQTIREEMAIYKVEPDVEIEKTILPKGSPINDELPDGHPFKGIIGIFNGGPEDTAERAEEILESEVNSIDGFGPKHS